MSFMQKYAHDVVIYRWPRESAAGTSGGHRALLDRHAYKNLHYEMLDRPQDVIFSGLAFGKEIKVFSWSWIHFSLKLAAMLVSHYCSIRYLAAWKTVSITGDTWFLYWLKKCMFEMCSLQFILDHSLRLSVLTIDLITVSSSPHLHLDYIKLSDCSIVFMVLFILKLLC